MPRHHSLPANTSFTCALVLSRARPATNIAEHIVQLSEFQHSSTTYTSSSDGIARITRGVTFEIVIERSPFQGPVRHMVFVLLSWPRGADTSRHVDYPFHVAVKSTWSRKSGGTRPAHSHLSRQTRPMSFSHWGKANSRSRSIDGLSPLPMLL